MVSVFNRAVVQLLPLVPRSLVWRFSKRYIAGTTLQDAFSLIRELNDQGIRATIDLLGEDSYKAEEARKSRDIYLEALRGIQENQLDCNISIKLSQMGMRFDLKLCREISRDLVVAAGDVDNFVRIDMEDSSVTTVTLDIYRELRKEFSQVGTVVQSYLRRTREDVNDLLAAGPTHLRLCKGIYVESEEIAYKDRQEIRDNFVAVMEDSLKGGIRRLAIATHDPYLTDAAEKYIADNKVPKEQYEFQMLLGVAENLRSELVGRGHPMRVYVPFGEAWYAYSSRRLRENPEIAGHVIKNLFSSG